jgi:hypothetical protein
MACNIPHNPELVLLKRQRNIKLRETISLNGNPGLYIRLIFLNCEFFKYSISSLSFSVFYGKGSGAKAVASHWPVAGSFTL